MIESILIGVTIGVMIALVQRSKRQNAPVPDADAPLDLCPVAILETTAPTYSDEELLIRKMLSLYASQDIEWDRSMLAMSIGRVGNVAFTVTSNTIIMRNLARNITLRVGLADVHPSDEECRQDIQAIIRSAAPKEAS